MRRPPEPGDIRSTPNAVWWSLCLCVVCFALPPFAVAQPALDVQRFQPRPGRLVGATLSDPRALGHLQWMPGLSASYAYDVVPRQGFAGDYALVDLQTTELSVALGLYDRVEVGLSLPLSYARQSASARAVTERKQLELGDARTMAKVELWRGPLSVALVMDVQFPTSTAAYPFGDPRWRLRPFAIARLEVGSLVIGTSLGYQFRRTTHLRGLVVGDALLAAAAVEVALARPVSLFTELQAELSLAQRGASATPSASELLAGLALAFGREGEVRLGGGSGRALWPSGYGSPALRVFAHYRIAFDGSGCGESGRDACGGRDSDGDGIPDSVDRCPTLKEDADGFADEDGCPDADDDADGIPDSRDRCPRLTEDRDGFEDDDGCPEPDNDQDGVADGFDACALEAEDRDGFQDSDGCPEPGPEVAAIVVAEDRILVSQNIYFEHDRDVIRAVSLPLLEQVARVIADLPEGTRVQVLGHTDDAGNADYNLDLSYRRARAVSEFLRSRGIPAEQLLYEGRGGTEPVGPNDSPEGRALNRRVEFRLLGPAGTP